jgi:hypothetical protein
MTASCDGKRFVVHTDEKLTAFVELERAIRACGGCAAGLVEYLANRLRFPAFSCETVRNRPECTS